jgi:diaminopimelate decarboxylase
VLYGAGYEAYLPDRFDEPRPLACSIAGKHCEQGDLVVADARLPEGVGVGDLLAVPVTGAYGYSMASNYNKVPRPAVVFVRDGRSRIVVRRETPDDLLRLDADESARLT